MRPEKGGGKGGVPWPFPRLEGKEGKGEEKKKDHALAGGLLLVKSSWRGKNGLNTLLEGKRERRKKKKASNVHMRQGGKKEGKRGFVENSRRRRG